MTSAIESGRVPEWTIADRARKARETAQLKQDELAERMGVARSTVQRIEQGVPEPRRTLLISWSFATGVDLGWLETGKTPTGPETNGGVAWGHRGSNPGPMDYGLKNSRRGVRGVA